MPNLATFQRVFLNDLYHGGDASAGWLKHTGRIAPVQSLQVYHHSSMGILQDALLSAFPVVTRLVGEAFMRAMLKEFMRAYPMHGGDVNAYGAALADFIQHFPPAAGLTYLSDVARLEWSMHRAVFAADAPCLNPQRLAELSTEDSAHVHLIPHPSLSLLASPYPIEAIWLANQPDAADDATVDLNEGGARLTIWRPELDVLRWNMTPSAFNLLQHLAGGASIALAIHTALEQEGITLESLQADLGTPMAHGLFTDVHLNPTKAS